MLRIFGTGMAFWAVATAALAQDVKQDDSILWRTLTEGDTPNQAAQKLAAMPEVKKVAVKRSSEERPLRISLRGGGVSVFSEEFAIAPEFLDSKLQRVSLVGKPSCLTDWQRRYDRLMDVMESKYPDHLTGRRSASEFYDLVSRVTENTPDLLTTALANEQTGVLFVQRVTRFDPPPQRYVNDRLARKLEGYLWQQYNQKVSECARHGAYRITHIVIYMSRPELDRQLGRSGS